MYARIRELYAVEAKAKDNALSDAALAAYRQEHAGPVLRSFADWLAKEVPKTTPKSDIGDALGYAANQWTTLVRYIDDGRLTIDNSPAEQAIRPLAIGRRNWLQIAGDGGLASAAVLLSIAASIKRQGINPWVYVKDILTQCAGRQPESDHTDLLSDEWPRLHTPFPPMQADPPQQSHATNPKKKTRSAAGVGTTSRGWTLTLLPYGKVISVRMGCFLTQGDRQQTHEFENLGLGHDQRRYVFLVLTDPRNMGGNPAFCSRHCNLLQIVMSAIDASPPPATSNIQALCSCCGIAENIAAAPDSVALGVSRRGARRWGSPRQQIPEAAVHFSAILEPEGNSERRMHLSPAKGGFASDRDALAIR